MRSILKLCITAVFILPTAAAAQDYSACNQILAEGARDQYDVTSLNQFRSYIRELLNYSHEEISEYVTSGSGNISVPVPIAEAFIQAQAAGGFDERLFDSLYTKYSSDLTRDLSTEDFETVSIRVFNPDVVSAWKSCIETLSSSSNDIRYEVLGKGDDVFSVRFRYFPNESTDPEKVVVEALTVTGGARKHIPTRIKSDTEMTAFTGYTQTFRRTDRASPISITLDLKGREGAVVNVAPLRRQDVLPIGTVITSLLPWPTFAEIADTSSSFSAEANLWAPCDGRSIIGSELSVATGRASTPDLRGVFLRGLNSFSSDEPSTVPARQRDPERRTPGSFQGHSLAAHSHNYVDQHGEDPGDWGPVSGPGNQTGSSSKKTSTVGGKETRPNNVAVFYYIKIN